MPHPTLAIMLLFTAVTASAHSFVPAVFGTHDATKNASISALVIDSKSGDTIDVYQPELVLAPASCTKLIATATALDMLGSDYRIPTYLQTDGSVRNGVLQGNLYITGMGDPTLGSKAVGNPDFLKEWVSALQKQGIRKITGRIVADLSMFSPSDATQPAWLWGDLGNYYGPGIFALAYKDNSMRIHFRSGEVGTTAEVDHLEPDYPGLVMANHVVCADINYDDAYCNGMAGSNERILTGRIPAGRGTFSIKGDIPNPGLLLAMDFTQALREAGIRVKGEATTNDQRPLTSRNTLYTHRSEPLSKIVERINIVSDNLYAEMLFRHIGLQRETPSTIGGSIRAEETYWSERGVDLSTAIINDGCGLSPANAISARQFVDLLTYMRKSKAWDAFYASLPVSGTSGTLSTFLRDCPLTGCVHAKSGSIAHVKSYSGYIKLPDGRNYTFSIIVNNANCGTRTLMDLMEKYLLAVCQ